MIINFKDELTKLLLVKNGENDVSLTLNMPDQKFKKYADKFNSCVKELYDRYPEREIRMLHIILSLNEYFDMKWLIDNILDHKIIKILELESKIEYKIKEDGILTKNAKEWCANETI